MDSFSNIGFIASKLMVLQSSLRTVQLGQDKGADAPSVRLLSLVVGFCTVSAIIWVVVALVCADKFNSVAKLLKQNDQAIKDGKLLQPNQETIETGDFFNFFFGLFIIAATSLTFASLSTFLYIKHIGFHLKRYLISLEKNRSITADDENSNFRGRLSKFNPFTKFAKSISGNLRRLQLSVALIALSFVFKVTVYILLAFGFGDNKYDSGTSCPEDPSITYSSLSSLPSQIANSTLFFLCDGRYVSKSLIRARSLLGSPLVIPILVLMTDPFMIM
jgi:hypothetical protein